MAKFVEVPGSDGTPGYINPEHVVAVLPGSATKDGPTLVGVSTVLLSK